MSPDYLVSALVSVYDSRKFIEGCLDDLLAQTLYQQDRLEVIIVNTDSPGGEDAIIRDYVAGCAHFVYLPVPQRESVYAAWNRGIVLARAPFLTSASTDDRHRPDALELAADLLEREHAADPAVALVCYPSYIHSKPNQVWSDRIKYERLYSGKEDADGFADNDIGPNPVWWIGLHRTWGLFDATFRGAGDHDFYSMKARQTHQFKRHPEPLGLWYRDARDKSNLGYLSESELDRINLHPEPPSPEALAREWSEWEEKNQAVEILRSPVPTASENQPPPPRRTGLLGRLFGS
ncbi:MAG: glycosyltransferase family A protein [Verrucomicrobiota bacterium]